MIGANKLAGIYAVKPYSAVTPPVDPFGDLKILGKYGTAGLSGAITEGDLFATSPCLDVDTLSCSTLYQRYRVFDGVDDVDFFLTGIDGSYAISCSNLETQYVAITPYNSGAGLKVGSNWAADCTLEIGVGINLVDCGVNTFGYEVLILAPGKFFIFNRSSVASDIGDPIREFTIKIIEYTDSMTHSEIPILVDLDALGVPSNFHFSTGNGVRGACLNHVTGEFTVVLNAIHFTDGYSVFVCLNIDPDTGTILNSIVDAPPSYVANGYMSALIGQSVINGDCFNRSTFIDTETASVGNTVVLRPYPDMTRVLYASRGVSAPPTAYTTFSGTSSPAYFDINNIINDRLDASGFTPTGFFDFVPVDYIPCAI